MAKHGIEISLYPAEQLATNLANRTMQHYTLEEPPHIIDCGDERPVSQISAVDRPSPGRYFGGIAGITMSGLVATSMQHENGHAEVKRLLSNYKYGFAELMAMAATNARSNRGIQAHIHSADIVENNPMYLSRVVEGDINCKWVANYGLVVSGAGSAATRAASQDIYTLTDSTPQMAVKETQQHMDAMVELLGGSGAKVSRAQALALTDNPKYHLPVVILAGEHCDADEASVTIDFPGLTATADGKNYHQSLKLPEVVLPHAMPDQKFDSGALMEAGLLIATSTTQALGVRRMQVIAAHEFPLKK